MRLRWAAIVLVSGTASLTLAFAGCGSDSSDDVGTDTDSGDAATGNDTSTPTDGSFIDAITDGGRDPDGSAACVASGGSCAKGTECCTANCELGDAGTGTCEAPVTQCKLPGTTCATGNECCTFSCAGGTCSNLQCVADNAACGVDSDCCSQSCAPDGAGGGKCAPLNPTGKPTSGNPCTMSSQCASGWCNNGVCSNPSYCVQDTDICSSNGECCNGTCVIAAGKSVGTCGPQPSPGGTKSCQSAGTICTPVSGPCGGDCCSRECAPYAVTGVSICQPESGCRATGEICRTGSDCCGGTGQPDNADANVQCLREHPTDAVGRCGNGNQCLPAGDVCKLDIASCSTDANCCSAKPGSTQNKPWTCRQDALGVPRCLIADETTEANPGGCVNPSGTCASSADCCNGLPCIPNPSGTGLVCGTACIPQGNACTTSADCCTGLPCAISPGAAQGVCGGTILTDGGVSDAGGGPITNPDGGSCALFGQKCDAAGPVGCCMGAGQCLQNPSTGAYTCRFP